jgi:hypothetical protein
MTSLWRRPKGPGQSVTRVVSASCEADLGSKATPMTPPSDGAHEKV